MKIVYFTHSLASCWNHGNAHFQRGVLRELGRRGHKVIAYEPRDGWSRTNLHAEAGEEGLSAYRSHYPGLVSSLYDRCQPLEAGVGDADVVVVHEWTDPEIVAALGRARKHGARFLLLFHDTHHRAVSDPNARTMFDLSGFDAILAFGGAVAEIYEGWGWRSRVFVWHEAADIDVFKPVDDGAPREGVVWIGNWGDGERSEEIVDYLLAPVQQCGVPLDVYGVRYPQEAKDAIESRGGTYLGWLPNVRVPETFARYLATVHVPRRYYSSSLPGIPTIRVFEALACGMPLLSGPWDDQEGLFRPGSDFLLARDPAGMLEHLRLVLRDPEARRELGRSGLETIRARHTCAHRAEELLAIVGKLGRKADERVVA